MNQVKQQGGEEKKTNKQKQQTRFFVVVFFPAEFLNHIIRFSCWEFINNTQISVKAAG